MSPFNSQNYLNQSTFIQSFNPINIAPPITPAISNTRIWINNEADLFYFNNDVIKGFESMINTRNSQFSLTVEKDISSVNISNCNNSNNNNNSNNTSDMKEKEVTKHEKSGFLDELANLALSINSNNSNNCDSIKHDNDSNQLNSFSCNFMNIQSNNNYTSTDMSFSVGPSVAVPLQQQQQQQPYINTIEANNNNNNVNGNESVVQTVNFISDIAYQTSKQNSISIIQIGEYERNDILYLNILHNPNPVTVIPYNKEYDFL